MASYVVMLKQVETEEIVVYKFGPNETTLGEIQLDKETLMFREMTPVPVANPTFYFDRAAQRLARCWKEGSFPDRVVYAS